MTTKVVAGNPVNERKKAKKWTPHGIQKVRKFKTICGDYRVSYSRSHRLFLEATSSQKVFSLDQISIIIALPTIVCLRDTLSSCSIFTNSFFR